MIEKRHKIMAVIAGGAVLGVGGTLTLAAWLDTEWVFGGTDGGGPGIGTSTFDVVQDASDPFDAASPTWASFPDNPGDNLSFGTGALSMAPGEAIYAPVALTTTADSIAGTLTLGAAVPATGVATDDAGQLLWDFLEVEAAYTVLPSGQQPPVCDAANFGDFTALAMTGTGLGATPAAVTVGLDAEGDNVAHYCFSITLPATLPGGAGFELNDLQGRTVAPAWEFTAESA